MALTGRVYSEITGTRLEDARPNALSRVEIKQYEIS